MNQVHGIQIESRPLQAGPSPAISRAAPPLSRFAPPLTTASDLGCGSCFGSSIRAWRTSPACPSRAC